MKYVENNFQPFIPINHLMVYLRDIFDRSLTDQRRSLDKVILTPDVITGGSRLPKSQEV